MYPSMDTHNGFTRPPSVSEDPSSTTRSLSSLLNRLSNASVFSIRTILPHYSPTDITEDSHPSPSTSSCISPQTDEEPPRYSLLRPPNPTMMSWNDDDKHEFRYSYPISSKKPWATLHLHTRDAAPGILNPLLSQPRIPRYWSCDPIKGTIDLDLDAPHNIQQINILVNGNVIISSLSEESLPFLGHEFMLWDKSMRIPLKTDHDNTEDDGALKRKTDGRFAPGHYSFPFSFQFPSHPNTVNTRNTNSISPFPPLAVRSIRSPVQPPTFPLREYIPQSPGKTKRISWASPFTSSSGSPSGTGKPSSSHSPTSVVLPSTHHSLVSRLPQSFMEKDIKADVVYDISVRIVHGRFKPSSRIKTHITYVPESRPHPSSGKRREAYEADGLLPCPMDDPDGWLAWPTLRIYGSVNINPDTKPRHTKAECTIYLAQPSSYARGSVIPCFLSICSDDEELVQMLSNPNSPTLRLLRCIQHPIGEIDESTQLTNGVFLDAGFLHSSPPVTTILNGKLKVVRHEVGRAQWWIPSKEVIQSPNVRHLEGEIHLSPTLPPNCDLELFRVEYAVELMPFRTEQFELEIHPSPSSRIKLGHKDTVLAANPVEITTLYREDEPIPTLYTAPPKINLIHQIDS